MPPAALHVWVTRDEPRDGPLCAALAHHGLTPLWEPVLQKTLCAQPADLIRDLAPNDWLVLTSPFAIDAFADVADARALCVAVVGEPSAERARGLGLRVALVGSDGHGATLFRALRERVTSGRVCYPRSALADPPTAWGGVTLSAPVLYDTAPRAIDAAVADRADVISVTSPSAVAALEAALPRFSRFRYASIGRTTSAALQDRGVTPWVQADAPSLDGLAAAIARAPRS